VALVRIDDSEEGITSIIGVEIISELGTAYKTHMASHPRRWHSSQSMQ
jgi:hypothetical protein